jgi:hypothetical protein
MGTMEDEAFDPEKVERWNDENAAEHHIVLEVVAASDYDQLLALYRKVSIEVKPFHEGIFDIQRTPYPGRLRP